KCLWPLKLAWIHTIQVEGSASVRIENLFGLCEVGRRLANFEKVLQEDVKLPDIFVEYLEIDHVLRHIRAGDIIGLENSKRHAINLLELLERTVKTDQEGYKFDEPFGLSVIRDIKDTMTRFLHALSDELSGFPI